MSDDNIILFPENKIVRRNQTGKSPKQSSQVRQKQTRQYVETNIDLIARQILQQFVDMGLKTTSLDFTKDLALTIDCLRGLVYRDFGVKHPAQDLSSKMVTIRKDLDGNQSAKLNYQEVLNLKKPIKTEPISDDTKFELDDINNPIDFEPDFDPDRH